VDDLLGKGAHFKCGACSLRRRLIGPAVVGGNADDLAVFDERAPFGWPNSLARKRRAFAVGIGSLDVARRLDPRASQEDEEAGSFGSGFDGPLVGDIDAATITVPHPAGSDLEIGTEADFGHTLADGADTGKRFEFAATAAV